MTLYIALYWFAQAVRGSAEEATASEPGVVPPPTDTDEEDATPNGGTLFGAGKARMGSNIFKLFILELLTFSRLKLFSLKVCIPFFRPSSCLDPLCSPPLLSLPRNPTLEHQMRRRRLRSQKSRHHQLRRRPQPNSGTLGNRQGRKGVDSFFGGQI